MRLFGEINSIIIITSGKLASAKKGMKERSDFYYQVFHKECTAQMLSKTRKCLNIRRLLLICLTLLKSGLSKNVYKTEVTRQVTGPVQRW